MKRAYLFWYKSDEYATTEYIYVIAITPKQARYFWFKYIREDLGAVYDYTNAPVGDITEEDFETNHNVGDILGQYAVI